MFECDARMGSGVIGEAAEHVVDSEEVREAWAVGEPLDPSAVRGRGWRRSACGGGGDVFSDRSEGVVPVLGAEHLGVPAEPVEDLQGMQAKQPPLRGAQTREREALDLPGGEYLLLGDQADEEPVAGREPSEDGQRIVEGRAATRRHRVSRCG